MLFLLTTLTTPLAASSRVTLSDGQVLVGEVVRQEDGSVILTLTDGEVLEIPVSAVAKVTELRGEASQWGPDPNVSRYLYTPTSFSLGEGRGYVAQRALAITSAGIGLTDFLDVEVGTVLPTLFTEAPLAVVSGKLSTEVSDKVRISGGAQAFAVPEALIGFVFGGATFGPADQHASLSGGVAMDFQTGQLGAGVATVSAMKRIGPSTALITENWFFWFMFENDTGPWGIPLFAVPAGGVRLFGPRFATDLALVPIFTGARELPVLPMPWVSFAWNFDTRD